MKLDLLNKHNIDIIEISNPKEVKEKEYWLYYLEDGNMALAVKKYEEKYGSAPTKCYREPAKKGHWLLFPR